jgi:hypothetical protein
VVVLATAIVAVALVVVHAATKQPIQSKIPLENTSGISF